MQVVVFQGPRRSDGGALCSVFAINLLEVWLFRAYGFLAPLTLRLAYYLIWNIIGGALPLSGLAQVSD
ncbi:MAG TPA: hypothetical protein VF510_10725 [Ktedonobacterales bacterium]